MASRLCGALQGGLWEKIDAAAAVATTTGATPAAQSPSAPAPSKLRRIWNRWRWRAVNVVATIAWLYVVCKIFIFDVDQYVVDRLWPQGGWLITYRFFILLGIAAVLALIFKRWWFFSWGTYFVLFPLIVVVWWVPRAIYKSRSWVALLAVLNVITTFVYDFKFILVSKAAALISIVLILVNPIRPLTAAAGVVLLTLLVATYARTVAVALQPSRFVGGQQRAIDKIVGSEALTNLWKLSEDLKDPQIVKFDSAQMAKFMQAVTFAAVIHRALYFWAYQLDTYRRGSTPSIFNLLSYMWLFIETVIAFAFINLALYRFDSTAYTYAAPPQLFDFFHYTINLILQGTVPTLDASSRVAVALADVIRLTGPVVLLAILFTVVLSLKQSRQDEEMKQSIERIKARGRRFDNEFQAQYEVSIVEAIDRLREVPGLVVRVAAWFSRQIPQDFEEQ